jgi:tripartite-type tricarboxylate transporter receptor subunit TctC
VNWESTSHLIAPPKFPEPYYRILVKGIRDAVHDPEYKKFVTERNARWEYIPPEQVIPTFEKQSIVVKEILRKGGILKEQ